MPETGTETGKESSVNLLEKKYSDYALVWEMLETVDVVRKFNSARTEDVAKDIQSAGRLFLTGESSSRIFPAKNTIRKALTMGLDVCITTEGSRQGKQYDLSDAAVFCASNSGRTKEVLLLAKKLTEAGSRSCYGLTAAGGTFLEDICTETFILTCGKEKAVAATKSVVEQALFYESILQHIAGRSNTIALPELAENIEKALTTVIDPFIIETAAKAGTIYFAGYNDGIAEELTLKTNEITRKKSDYLEGTYAVHGIEEVMNKDDIVFVVDPVDEEIEKFQEVLVNGVGLEVVAIANRDTPFTTIQVPDTGEMNSYIYLCAGWNLLVEIGLSLSINLDKPVRARKIGNEFIE